MITLMEFIEQEKIDIDRDILKNIIDIIESKWLYLSEEIVCECMGYTGIDAIRAFYRNMKPRYKLNIL